MKKCFGCMRDYPDSESACPVCGWSDYDAEEMLKAAPEVLPSETILNGRYITGRVLSLNDFSILYLAWDALLEKRVVIRELFPYRTAVREERTKMILLSSESDRQFFETCLASFMDEVSKLGRSQDIPEILQYYRCFMENGTAYCVTEYIEGCTLEDLLVSGTYDPAQAFLIVKRVGQVLNQLHLRGIVHKNLSPDSIYFDNAQNLRLIDFGEAKCRFCQMRGDMEGIMDMRYAAPELLDSRKSGAAADLYALGAVYYRIVTGRMPPIKRKEPLRVKNSTADIYISELTGKDPGIRRKGFMSLIA